MAKHFLSHLRLHRETATAFGLHPHWVSAILQVAPVCRPILRHGESVLRRTDLVICFLLSRVKARVDWIAVAGCLEMESDSPLALTAGFADLLTDCVAAVAS